MTNEEILANGSEGATHFDGNTYFRFEMYEHGQAYLVLKNGGWDRGLPAYPVYGCRSISDIRRIVELEERLETPTGLQEFICVEQMKSLPLAEIHRANQTLHERAESAERERDKLKPLLQFVDGCIKCCFDGCSYDGADMQDNLVETGVLVVETYSKDKHGDINSEFDFEEGDDIYLIAPWFKEQISKQLNGGE